MKVYLSLLISLLVMMFLFSACQTSQPAKEQTSPDNQSKKFVFNVGTDSLAQVFNGGKKLFEKNCIQCHTTTNERSVGPGLKGVLERRRIDWVRAFIQNSQKLIASGDTIARNLYDEYNQSQMQSFLHTPEEMQKLLFFLGNIGYKGYMTLDEIRQRKK